MNLHKEIHFETEICAHLAANGWLYAEKDAADYDRQLALFSADVLAWVQETQPDAWEVLSKNHAGAAGQTLLNRLRDSLNQSGTLRVLRQGFDVLGTRSKIKMAQFKPALAMNSDIMQRYAANRLRVVRQVSTVLEEGPGHKYLIQHSAGSGKTMSIAWTAHFFGDLHDASDKKVFDSVIVVSDRNVIDGQLQDPLQDFERTKGVVATIKGDSGSKSAELAEALSGDKKIVVCTIQTFPYALETVRELAATEGKRFAVIADEAHSSQTGQAAAKLKQSAICRRT